MSGEFIPTYDNNEDDEMFNYDIENNDAELCENNNKNDTKEELLLPQPKSILYYPNNNDNITLVIIKVIVVLFMMCFVMPFIILDLYFAYTDTSCVNIYPNKLKITLSIYLQVNSYMMIIAMTTQTLLIFDKIKIYNYSEIIQIVFGLFMIVSRIAILGWNIIGALIFWGFIIENGGCSVIIYNYLFASFVIRILVIALLIANNKNNLKIS